MTLVIVAVITGLFGLAGIALQNRRLRNENSRDHASVEEHLVELKADVRDTRADVRDLKKDVRHHGERLNQLEEAS